VKVPDKYIVTIHLPKEVYACLKEYADMLNLSVGNVITRIILREYCSMVQGEEAEGLGEEDG